MRYTIVTAITWFNYYYEEREAKSSHSLSFLFLSPGAVNVLIWDIFSIDGSTTDHLIRPCLSPHENAKDYSPRIQNNCREVCHRISSSVIKRCIFLYYQLCYCTIDVVLVAVSSTLGSSCKTLLDKFVFFTSLPSASVTVSSMWYLPGISKVWVTSEPSESDCR